MIKTLPQLRKIYMGNDHAATAAKKQLWSLCQNHYQNSSVEWINLGTDDENSVHYPQIAWDLACKVQENFQENLGILLCGTGIGVSIMANKVRGIRAARCCFEEDGRLASEHNHANIICLGARTTTVNEMFQIVEAWLSTTRGDQRHELRVKMMGDFEK